MKTVLVIGALAVSALAGPLARAEVGPYPRDEVYPYGLRPSGANHDDLTAAYSDWKRCHVTVAGAGNYRRVVDPLRGNATVSEGIGYGMLIAACLDDRALFDDLWGYYGEHRNANGFMSWKIGVNGVPAPAVEGGEASGEGAATDGDQDVAYALIQADLRWGSAGAVDYRACAVALIDRLYNRLVKHDSGLLMPGDSFGDEVAVDNLTDPSYFAPAYYRAFKEVTGDGRWDRVIARCYSVLAKAAHSGTGLVPDWCDIDGHAVGSWSYGYGYDACRTPWRLAMDYVWYGTPEAAAYCERVTAFAAGIGSAGIRDGYALDGTCTGLYHTSPFVGTFAAGAMASSDAAYCDAGYADNVATAADNYYNRSLKVLTLALQTGNFIRMPLGNRFRYVRRHNPTPSFPYASWETAATNIQTAVNLTPSGGCVLVSNGVYDISSTIQVWYGITIRGVNGPTSTIVRSDGTTHCFYLDHPGAALRGLSITGGRDGLGGGVYVGCNGGTVKECHVYGNYAEDCGGGIECTEGALIEDCEIYDNTTEKAGGGIHANYGGTVRRCRVMRNHADSNKGGGVCLKYGAVMEDSIIVSNTASWGGGVSCEGESAVRRCVIAENRADVGLGQSGGGFYVAYAGGGPLENCMIVSNRAGWGGGAQLYGYGQLVNCLVWNNEATYRGGGLYASTSGAVVNCIVYSNSAPVGPNYDPASGRFDFLNSCTTPQPVGGDNTALPPVLTLQGVTNVVLDPRSPCIDAGCSDPNVTRDLNGDRRPLNATGGPTSRWDIGPVEYASPRGDTDADGVSDAAERTIGTNPHEADTDHDGMTDGDELVAGTSPLNSSSRLELRTPAFDPGAGRITLCWSSVTGRFYRVMGAGALTDNPAFGVLADDVPASPAGETGVTIDVDRVTARYYRVDCR